MPDTTQSIRQVSANIAVQASRRTTRVARSTRRSTRPMPVSGSGVIIVPLPSAPPDAGGRRRLATLPSAAIASSAAARPMFPVTRSWGGAGSSAQPRLAQGGTPPGTTTTAGTRVTPNRRNRRGSMATPASAPPRRAPMRLTVARNPPSPTPRSTRGAPILAASRATCRQLSAGTDRLVNRRISGVLPRSARPSARRAAWRSAGSGAAVSPDDPGTVCLAVSPARSRARSMIERLQAPRSSSPVPPARRSTSSTSPRTDPASSPTPPAGGTSSARTGQAHASSRRMPASPATIAPARMVPERFRADSTIFFSTAGSRNSRRRPAVRAALPTAPRSVRSGCSPCAAWSPGPAGSSASGIAISS